MASFSFDIVSEIDKAEMNNVFMQSEKEIQGRYDFKGTSAAIDWLDDKKGLKITGDNDWQVDAVLDIVRKKLVGRGQSSKVLDLSKEKVVSNLKTTWEIPFKQGLDQPTAKQITANIRANAPKAKPQIQGDLVRVTSASKDELQKVISLLRESDYDTPLQFVNYR
ncbi:YajQ family cyclic di-GMP-binding protein [Candidatus Nanosynbacter sp. HMT-352]|uniref:YajQ family cyclic di-GMP-binding protein n=1 Tax=Candidatus Nanosynbacter sp. HMT-352 TaxID=2899133 RepID=UPI001FB5EF18|nr:YajQ family cyclic di-GMP-binding protein [Candidatus Nanosynbacter sp. HMT-352]UOG66203.1 YajQ family cyclic di-GMP-binding protein [Candidatus Nanosynbacter sp. HMT-352]